MENKVVSPILIGAKSIGQYGGYESFIYKLLEYHREQKTFITMYIAKLMAVGAWM
mgnify:CR=1 FL=1